jgi:hypothetical protein
MSKRWKACLALFAVLIVTYVRAVTYANTDSNSYGSLRYVGYTADKYESDTPPAEWYTPEQLGICEICEYQDGAWLAIGVDREREPFPLQEKQPIFMYKDKPYQVDAFWTTPAIGVTPTNIVAVVPGQGVVEIFPDQVGQQQSLASLETNVGTVLGVSLAFTGIVFLYSRKKQYVKTTKTKP